MNPSFLSFLSFLRITVVRTVIEPNHQKTEREKLESRVPTWEKKETSSSPPRKSIYTCTYTRAYICVYTRRWHPVGPQQFHLIGPNSVLSLEKEKERRREAESDVFVRPGSRAKFLALTTLFSCIASQLSSTVVYIDRGPKERKLSPPRFLSFPEYLSVRVDVDSTR